MARTTITRVPAPAPVRHLLPRLTERDSVDLIAAATAMSGAFWQMATPGPEVATLYRSDPRLAHASSTSNSASPGFLRPSC
jgi:hypothetical protein